MGLACQTQTRADLCCFALRSLLVHHRVIPTITTMADVAPEVVATPEVAEEKAEEAPATNGEAAKEETNGEAKEETNGEAKEETNGDAKEETNGVNGHSEEAKDEANDAEKRTAEEAEIEPIAVSPEKKAKLEEANETPAETPAEVTA